MYGLSGERITEDDISASVITETDTSLQNSTTLPTIDEDNNTTATTGKSDITDLIWLDEYSKLIVDIYLCNNSLKKNPVCYLKGTLFD